MLSLNNAQDTGAMGGLENETLKRALQKDLDIT
jgi:hypothetical protein